MTTQPDLLVVNARIWTGDPSQPYAEALAIKADRILAVGFNNQIRPMRGKHTKIVDAAGHMVLPGCIDNHTHLMAGGFQLLSLDLREVKSKDEFIQAIAGRANRIPNGCWIAGGGWNNDQWVQNQVPVKEWIDCFTPDIPVFVTRSDLHIGFANSAALRLAGINRTTADPAGGIIDRDPHTGDPSGILRDNAMKLVQQCIPEPSQQQYDEALKAAMRQAARLGITSVQDITAWHDWNDWRTFRRFQQQQQLTLRI